MQYSYIYIYIYPVAFSLPTTVPSSGVQFAIPLNFDW